MIPYPIGDMLTRIRNASARFHPEVSMPHSKMKEAIARILEQEGFIESVTIVEQEPQNVLKIALKYKGERMQAKRAINRIQLVSKPSRRIYVGSDDIPRPLGGMGMAILSTSQGVMSGKEAKAHGIGGEVLCEVW